MDKDDEDDCKTFSLGLLIAFGITIIASGFFILFFFVLYKWLFYVAAVCELFVILMILSEEYNSNLKDKKYYKQVMSENDSSSDINSLNLSNDENTSNINDNTNDENESNIIVNANDENTSTINHNRIENQIGKSNEEIKNILSDCIKNVNFNISEFNKLIQDINSEIQKTANNLNSVNSIIKRINNNNNNNLFNRIDTINESFFTVEFSYCCNINDSATNFNKINEINNMVYKLVVLINKKFCPYNKQVQDETNILNSSDEDSEIICFKVKEIDKIVLDLHILFQGINKITENINDIIENEINN